MLKEAFALHMQGKFAEAERAYAELLRLQPDNVRALHLCGVLALQRGQAGQGIALISRALALEPRQPLAHRDLGNAHQQAGQFDEALAAYDRSLALKPDQADVHNNRGIALAKLNRTEDALASYERAIALKPDYAQAYNNRGTVLSGLGRTKEALADFDRAVAIEPRYAKALDNRGGALIRLRRGAEALESYDRALALDSGLASAHDGRGTALAMLQRPAEALESHDRAIALDPGSANTHNNRGAALAALGRAAEALESHDRALALDPGSALVHSNRGAALGLLDRMEESLESLDRALALDPGLIQAHTNRGNFLNDLGRHADALASFEHALICDPQSADAHFGKSQALLAEGRFAQAWPHYEWRKRRLAENVFHAQGRPEWTGQEDISGKTVFIEAEQGLGDTIQFCRYAPLVADRGARVVLTAQTSLTELLATLDPRVEILAVPDLPAAFDYHAALLSLPRAFATTVETAPAATPYLYAPPERSAAMRARIGDADFKIGVCWQGSAIAGTRSFPLRHLEEIARLPGVRLFSLQKGAGVEQLDNLPGGMRVETLGGNFPEDFTDTAAAMAAMELIISCDTSVAHLAGALGRPAFVALRHAADWRWLRARDDSVWYPGLRLFRQNTPGDWISVFRKMQAALASLTSGGQLT
jgi:tetratricopeptide (TPR) repeat protein